MTIICDVNYKPDGIYAGTARPFAKMMTKFRLWLNVYVHKTHDLHTPEFFLKKNLFEHLYKCYCSDELYKKTLGGISSLLCFYVASQFLLFMC
jgi:hypothetical protein